MNKAKQHPVITIRVVSNNGVQIQYVNYYEKNGRTHLYSATTGHDRLIIKDLAVGQGYYIKQVVDDRRTTHWTEAVPFGGTRRPADDVISRRVAKVNSKRKVRNDFLDLFDWDDPVEVFHDDILGPVKRAAGLI